MNEKNILADNELIYHVQKVLNKERRFENVAQSVSRMILEKGVQEKVYAGKIIPDFNFFREGKKHIIGWYEEINEFVHFVKGAAEGDSAKEMAFVLVGEPGNGKTFFINFICDKYRQFLSRCEKGEYPNRRYIFKFVGLDKALDYNEKVAEMQSLTFEDPIILAMNLHEDINQNKEFFAKQGFTDKAIEELYENRRSLGASTEYL